LGRAAALRVPVRADMPDGQAGRKQKMLAGTGLPARRETITGRYGVDMTRSV